MIKIESDIIIEDSETYYVDDTSQPHIECNSSSQPRIECYGTSQPRIECNDTSQPRIVCNDTSLPRIVCNSSSQPSIECYDNSITIHKGNLVIPQCYANSLFITNNQDMKNGEHVIVQPDKKYNFFERHRLGKADKYILYKRVSGEFKTQEGLMNETLWSIGSVVEHLHWDPYSSECGGGKFHAVAKPYFADQFRDNPNDKYIAIEIMGDDLYEWDNPKYSHKIAFRKGTVLYECDRDGNKVEGD